MSKKGSASLLVQGDPRRPDKVKKYRAPEIASEEQQSTDYFSLLSLLFGMGGVMMRYKWSAWCAVITCIASFANSKKSDGDTKQMMTSVSFSMMGLFVNYFAPKPPAAAGA
eukprot:GILK01003497.1.p1 GENE.GILK01003497.1~~GILK01003497.1.p1  ORF type:complete len:120 (+),score=12.33 GILK01003497.1:28-360(+)